MIILFYKVACNGRMELFMFDLSKHPYFTPYRDPKSGIVSYILTEKVAPLQRHFYFAQPSMTADGKYLWFLCFNPPAKYMTLGVVSLDPENPFIKSFPYAAPQGGSPCITPEGDGVYFGVDNSVYKLDLDGNLTRVITVGSEITHARPIDRLFTHASISADGKYIAMDMKIADHVYMSIGNLSTGEIKLLNKYGREYNHAMFSPTDPNLILLDQDWWRDRNSGEYFPIDNRMWLINTDATRFEPVVPSMFYGRDGTEMAHDYFSGDGYVCWSDYLCGAYECDLETRTPLRVWKRPIIHSHCSKHREYFVGDYTPYSWKTKGCSVIFYDRMTNKEIDIFSNMPYPEIWADRYYHVDPHPQFCTEDTFIVCEASVIGAEPANAITPVAEALNACRDRGEQVIPHCATSNKTSGWRKEIQCFAF